MSHATELDVIPVLRQLGREPVLLKAPASCRDDVIFLLESNPAQRIGRASCFLAQVPRRTPGSFLLCTRTFIAQNSVCTANAVSVAFPSVVRGSAFCRHNSLVRISATSFGPASICRTIPDLVLRPGNTHIWLPGLDSDLGPG